ncbi:MAG: hypothetical protein ACKO3V_14215 [Pirellula sp.]
MDVTRNELLDILRQSRELLARPSNCFDWSSWEDAEDALREMDARIEILAMGGLPDRLSMSVLFAPTGPIQEVSLSSGWSYEFLSLAERFDRAEKLAYSYS